MAGDNIVHKVLKGLTGGGMSICNRKINRSQRIPYFYHLEKLKAKTYPRKKRSYNLGMSLTGSSLGLSSYLPEFEIFLHLLQTNH